MAAVSKHPADVLKWITKVATSCKTYQQQCSAEKLCRLAEKMYPHYKEDFKDLGTVIIMRDLPYVQRQKT